MQTYFFEILRADGGVKTAMRGKAKPCIVVTANTELQARRRGAALWTPYLSDYEKLGRVFKVQPFNAPGRLARFNAKEEKAWEFYLREAGNRGYTGKRAAHFAWRQLQTDPDFPRLRMYDGAKA